MSRDTQFQGFANLLADELAELGSRKWDSLNEYMAAKRQLIARRAYDLAVYAVKNVYDINEYGDVGPLEDEEAQRRVGNLSDMTELPKEQNE
jgi:hypothetical protein